MTEATWGDAASPDINWRMSAALENVPRGEEVLAEVTSLEGAVRAWLDLDLVHREDAVLTPEHAIVLEGASLAELRGGHIDALARRLPGAERDRVGADSGPDDAG